MKVAVMGAAGRMGGAVIRVLAESDDLELVAAIDRSGEGDAGLKAGAGELGVAFTDDVSAVSAADVVIDFSLPEAATALFEACLEAQISVVSGTTNLSADAEALLQELAEEVPVVQAPNFSQGVTLLFDLAARAAKLAGPAFDAEIVEMHHRHKVDAPSGTAKRLAEVVAEAKELGDDPFVHGRSGHTGARTDGEVGVMTLRGGDVVGEHTLFLAAAGERLELTHRATDRTIFARGAVRAARWVTGQAPGRYDMKSVMGLGD
jgi:4-hydroxy-tetrahydrodipicolinate reductase